MAQKDSAPKGHTAHGTAEAAAGAHVAPAAHDAHAHAHPTWKQYKWVALILTLITVVEVWIYYVPAIVASRAFVPMLLIMSAVKFFIVVAFYMHLRYDHKLFRALFTAPLIIAMTTIVALLFLFGKLSARVGALT
jgi:cytochrome c oxidase subunit IV